MKVAIVILAGAENPESLGRVVNALMAAKEFKEAKDEIQIVSEHGRTQGGSAYPKSSGPAQSVLLLVFDRRRRNVCSLTPGVRGNPRCLSTIAKSRINLGERTQPAQACQASA